MNSREGIKGPASPASNPCSSSANSRIARAASGSIERGDAAYGCIRMRLAISHIPPCHLAALTRSSRSSSSIMRSVGNLPRGIASSPISSMKSRISSAYLANESR